ncbi:hypothetical protein TNCV_1068801 [Trichonephila clavipes]|nr:hypothetical protein TNCV_1068801 [Trichonephila clavipes]
MPLAKPVDKDCGSADSSVCPIGPVRVGRHASTASESGILPTDAALVKEMGFNWFFAISFPSGVKGGGGNSSNNVIDGKGRWLVERFKLSHSRFIVSDVKPLIDNSLTMETGFSKFFRSSLRDAEIILRAGQSIISEINILVENSQGSSQIPQLLNAEIKKKIARHMKT